MEHGDGDDERAVEPVRHVDVLDAAFRDRREKHDGEGDPDDGDQQVDRPFEFGVFLALRDAQRQRDRGEHDDQLPAPERERGQLVEGQPHVTGALHDIVGRREQGGSAKGEDHRVGVQRAQATVGQKGQVEVQLRPDELCRDEHAREHTDDTPDDDHDRELTNHRVIVRSCFVQREDPLAVLDCLGGGDTPGTSRKSRRARRAV